MTAPDQTTPETQHLQLELDVWDEAEIMVAEKRLQLAEAIEEVTEFLKKFGKPDHGPQRMTITMTSDGYGHSKL